MDLKQLFKNYSTLIIFGFFLTFAFLFFLISVGKANHLNRLENSVKTVDKQELAELNKMLNTIKQLGQVDKHNKEHVISTINNYMKNGKFEGTSMAFVSSLFPNINVEKLNNAEKNLVKQIPELARSYYKIQENRLLVYEQYNNFVGNLWTYMFLFWKKLEYKDAELILSSKVQEAAKTKTIDIDIY